MYSKEFFGSTDPNFNLDAAVQMYEFFNSEPEVAKALLHMHAHEVVSKALILEEDLIGDLIYAKYAARKDVVKRAVLNGVINKSMTDNTVEEISKAMDAIEKALGDEYTSWERSQNVKQQRRGPGGRFVKMGTTKIDIPQGVGDGSDGWKNRSYWDAQTEAYDRVAQNKGYGKPPTVDKSKSLNAAHSAAYLQIADALRRLDPTDLAMAKITYANFPPEGGAPTTSERTKMGQIPGDFFTVDEAGSGEIPISIDWYMDTESMGAGRYDILTGAGMSTEAALDSANMMSRSGPAMAEYSTSRQKYDGEYGGGKYNNLQATANMIDAIGGDKLSPKGKAALAAAQYVGQHGAEAEKILGPTSRRAAYRYRGVERKPDAKLERAALESTRGAMNTNQAREQLIHPKDVTEQVGLDFVHQDEHSPFIRYWQNQLPSRDYIQLHLDSGTTPPSQGVVLDAKGQIVTQAVGYGDDHYLPFNLKNLTRSNRGEWIRTRTMGGPTTEDVYAALISGTRSVTVVSHSGVYNIEFDESFRGGRRFNDKSKRMVRRYAQLLDTLDAESTTLQKIPMDRMEEIRNQVAAEIPGDGRAAAAARQKRIDELREVEKTNPTASAAQRSLWTAEFGQKYAEKLANNTGDTEMSWDGVKANLTIRTNADELLTDEQAIAVLRAGDSYEKFMKMKENEYRTSQKPLKLNGQGYYFALKALQEQFPYYIKRVEWYPADDEYGKDQGYVAHNFNRPKAAKEGFWDPAIEGVKGNIKDLSGGATGKVSARETDFQNYDARMRAKGVQPKSDESAPAASTAADTKSTADAPSSASQRVSDITGVQFTGLTPNPDLAKDTSVGRERRVAALQASEDLAKVHISYIGPDGVTKIGPIELGKAGFAGLPTLTFISGKNLDDPDVQEALAKDIASLLKGDASVPLSGGPSSLISMIREYPGGPELLEKYTKALVNKTVETPKSVKTGLTNVSQLWDFSAPGVNGADFLGGNNRQPADYLYTMRTDPDIQAIRMRYGQDPNTTWDSFVQGRTKEILTANEKLAMVKAKSFSGESIEYGNRTYNPRDIDELAAVLQQDALGIMKYRQLIPFLPANTDMFMDARPVPRQPGPPGAPKSIGSRPAPQFTAAPKQYQNR